MEKPPISGQFFVRKTSAKFNVKRAEEIIMLCGVIRVPKNLFDDETLFTTFGEIIIPNSTVQMNILLQEKVRIEELKPCDGYRIDQILTSPIWRV